MSKYYSINEFSKILGVSAQTLRNWDNKGKLHPHHTSSNGYRYYSHEQLNQVLNRTLIENHNKLDGIFKNTIITICNLYYGEVTDSCKNDIINIKKIIEGGGESDKINKSNVNPKQQTKE